MGYYKNMEKEENTNPWRNPLALGSAAGSWLRENWRDVPEIVSTKVQNNNETVTAASVVHEDTKAAMAALREKDPEGIAAIRDDKGFSWGLGAILGRANGAAKDGAGLDAFAVALYNATSDLDDPTAISAVTTSFVTSLGKNGEKFSQGNPNIKELQPLFPPQGENILEKGVYVVKTAAENVGRFFSNQFSKVTDGNIHKEAVASLIDSRAEQVATELSARYPQHIVEYMYEQVRKKDMIRLARKCLLTLRMRSVGYQIPLLPFMRTGQDILPREKHNKTAQK